MSGKIHNRVIVHIDIDCFYAQVEEILDPSLKDKKVGIQQKNIVVTANYEARKAGVKKLQLVSDALKACPELTLINGEDLTKYKKMSDQIFDVLNHFIPTVEKLGLDENFLDVTDLVNQAIASGNQKVELYDDTNIYMPPNRSDLVDNCDCDCFKRLVIGTQVAGELRAALKRELNITSCAGIAYNKLLAKLVGGQHKPNQQTVIFFAAVPYFISNLESVRSLVGVGHKLSESLAELNVKKIKDLQEVSHEVLRKKIDEKTISKLKSWCFGEDNSVVKPTGKQKTLSLEDSTFGNPLKNIYEVETKLRLLLTRLCDAVCEDNRIPTVLRVTVRKTNTIEDINQRESRQTPLPSNLFKSKGELLELANDNALPQLVVSSMTLFGKIMGDKKQDFTVTLLGVAFTKFSDGVAKGSNAIDRFLVRQNATSDTENNSNQTKRPHSTNTDKPIQPPPKRQKSSFLLNWIEKNKTDVNFNHETKTVNKNEPSTSRNTAESTGVPPNIDKQVFESLPDDIKEELIEQWKPKPKIESQNPIQGSSNKQKPTAKSSLTIDKFFKPSNH